MSRSKRGKQRARRRTKASERRAVPAFLFIAAGVLVLAGVILLALQPQILQDQADTALAYDPEDVVYDEGLYGVHEMEPSTTPIPFLPKDGPQPKLVIPHRTWDFGRVKPTEVVTHLSC